MVQREHEKRRDRVAKTAAWDRGKPDQDRAGSERLHHLSVHGVRCSKLGFWCCFCQLEEQIEGLRLGL